MFGAKVPMSASVSATPRARSSWIASWMARPTGSSMNAAHARVVPDRAPRLGSREQRGRSRSGRARGRFRRSSHRAPASPRRRHRARSRSRPSDRRGGRSPRRGAACMRSSGAGRAGCRAAGRGRSSRAGARRGRSTGRAARRCRGTPRRRPRLRRRRRAARGRLTESPACARYAAAARPLCPPPTMTTSRSLVPPRLIPPILSAFQEQTPLRVQYARERPSTPEKRRSSGRMGVWRRARCSCAGPPTSR